MLAAAGPRSLRRRGDPAADAGVAVRLADPRTRLPMWLHRVFLRAVRRARGQRGKPPGRRADPRSVQSRFLARHSGDRLPASALVHRQIRGGDLAGASAFWRRCSAPCSSTGSAGGPPPRSTMRSRTASSKARSWCCSPKAPPATATGCCRSAPRWSAPRRRRCVSDAALQVMLQPLAVAYTRRSGMPVTRRDRPFLAWYGDMELASASRRLRARRRRRHGDHMGRADPVQRQPQGSDRAWPRRRFRAVNAPIAPVRAGFG